MSISCFGRLGSDPGFCKKNPLLKLPLFSSWSSPHFNLCLTENLQLRDMQNHHPCTEPPEMENLETIDRGQKINANFFCTKFFENPSGHGRPRRKSWTSAPKSGFSCGPGDGEKLFDPRPSGRKGQECPREFRTKKFMFMLFFRP